MSVRRASAVVLLALCVGAFASARSSRRGPCPDDTRIRTSVKLNTDPAERLELLPNIGPTLARRIVDDREANGPFSDVDDLDRVRGIGEKTVEELRPYATVR